MGRYFQTATPQNIDFMYKLPEDLMLKATQQASNESTQQQSAIFSLYDKLKLQALSGDKSRAKEILGGYENQINDLSSQLQANPNDFRRKTADIINLSRNLTKDFTTGEAAGISNQYGLVAEWEKRQLENKDIKDKQSIELAKAKWLNDYAVKGGLHWNEASGVGDNTVPLEELYNTMDVNAKYDKYAKEMIAKKTAGATSGLTKIDGNTYTYKKGETTETLSMDEIKKSVNDAFMNDSEAQNYLKQRTSIGSVGNWYDKDQYGNATTLKTGKDSALEMMKNTVADKYDKDWVTSKTSSISADGYGLQIHSENMKNQVLINPHTGTYMTTPSLPQTSTQGLADQVISLRDAGNTYAYSAGKKLMDSYIGRLKIEPGYKGKDYQNAFPAKIQSAMQDASRGNVKPLKEIYSQIGMNNVEVSNIINQIEDSSRRALNIETQNKWFQDHARKVLNNPNASETDIKAKADELMKNADNQHQSSLAETNGYNLEGDKVINAGLKQISANFDAGVMPKSVIVQTTDVNGKIKNEVMSGSAFQTYWKDKNKTVGYITDPTDASQKLAVDKFGKLVGKKVVTKVLQSVNGIDEGGNDFSLDKPYKMQMDGETTILIPKENYQDGAIEKTLSTPENQRTINLENAIEDAKNDAYALVNTAQKTGAEFDAPMLKIANNVFYKPSKDPSGKGTIMIHYPDKVLYNGKMTNFVEAPEDDTTIFNMAKKEL